MRMPNPALVVVATLGAILSFPATAQTADPAESVPEKTDQKTKSKILVLVPEQIDVERFWYFYTVDTQHFVQAAIEKALLQAGQEVIDISAADPAQLGGDLTTLTKPAHALALAKQVGATYCITGQAMATSAGQSEAYDVPVHRATASVVAKVVRVSDGKVVAVEEANAEGGGQAARAAGQEALKDLGKSVAESLARTVSKLE